MNRLQKQLFSSIPQNWDKKKVSEVVFFQEGPGLLSSSFTKSGEGIPFLNIRCISEDGNLDLNQVQYVNKELATKKLSHFMLDAGDYVFSSSGTIGRVAEVHAKHLPLMLNTSIIRFRSLDKTTIDHKFLKHLIKSSLFIDQMMFESQGSAQVNVGPTHIKLCYFPIPSLGEQKKIAEILTSVDRVIELTLLEIDKLKDLKKGMMQELLTKGIGHTKFKDSPVGKIPESWDVKTLGELANDVTYGLTVRPEYQDDGVPLVSALECKKSKIDFNIAKKIKSEDFLGLRTRAMPSVGDILFSKTGTIGRISRVREGDPKFAITQNVALIKPKVEVISSEFMELYLNSESIAGQTYLGINALGVPDLQLGVMQKFYIAVPPKAEQEKLVSIFNSFTSKIESEEIKHNSITFLKKGLMNVLLTGKVRVKV